MDEGTGSTTRRRFLQGALATGGALLVGCASEGLAGGLGPGLDGGTAGDRFAGGTLVRRVEFSGEGAAVLDVPTGVGLDGRLYHDLSTLTPDRLVTPNGTFYIRTRYPDLLDASAPWKIAVKGLVSDPRDLSLADLAPMLKPMGEHLLECSGNGPFARFGMVSVAWWTGVPLTDLLARLSVLPQATRVLVSGFDSYSTMSARSIPGASWIFTFQQLADQGGFLATEMNGVPLPTDHGFPVRLVMPRWYGCSNVKWVNEIELVDDGAPATSHMQEYASRTMQKGVPALARDYLAASIDQAAMPVRVEQWRVAGTTLYRVVGIDWGGDAPSNRLQIRFGADQGWVAVDQVRSRSAKQPWALWSHAWRPLKTGGYSITLRVDDRSVPTRRLDAGFYLREVQIDEV